MMPRRIDTRLVLAVGLAGWVGAAALPAAAQQGTERTGQRAEEATERRTGSTGPLSDAWLTAKTKLALLADEEVSGTGIDVDTSGGVVTLKGEVKSQQEKARAVRIAREIEGVRQAIQQSWKAGQLRLEGDTLKGPQDTQIEVDVDDGVVTLEGKVTNIESGQPS